MIECKCSACRAARRKDRYPADWVAERYCYLGARLSSPKAQQLITTFGEVCAHCGKGCLTSVVKCWHDYEYEGLAHRGAEYEDLCSDCGVRWKGVEREEIRVRYNVSDSTRVIHDSNGVHLEKRFTAIPRGTGTHHRGESEGDFLRDIDEWRQVRRYVENRPRRTNRDRWDSAILSWLAYLEPTIQSYALVVDYGQAYRPKLSRWWTEFRVRQGVALAREEVLRRLRRERHGSMCRAFSSVRGAL